MSRPAIRNPFFHVGFIVPDLDAAMKEFQAALGITRRAPADAMTTFYADLFAALPDLQATTLAVVADEDTVWCRFVVEGTNEGSYSGFRRRGKRSGGTRSTPIA